MRRLGIGIILVVVGVAGVVVFRAATAPTGNTSDPGAATSYSIDRAGAIGRFAAGIRIPTISHATESDEPLDVDAFRRFHAHLEQSYPLVHTHLERATVSEYGLLYTWLGTDPALPPVVMMGHFDVVPVDPDSIDAWTHAPFDGVVADGYLWGRGTLDDKVSVFSLLEAVELLLSRGFAPRRTVYLSFGHDEELGGAGGAQVVAEQLRQRGEKPILVLDEGGGVASGLFPGLDQPVAAVGIAEKGSTSLELVVETAGGHSSTLLANTAIGILSKAVVALEENQMLSRFEGPPRMLVESLAPHLPFSYRLVASNLWLFAPIVERAMLRIELAAPLLRTTTAPTIIRAGVKENVLPGRARAVVNFRIYPGDTVASVREHAIRVVNDPRVRITALPKRREASSLSTTESESYELLARTIRSVYPDAIVAPFLITGGTDARYFRQDLPNVYGFMPVYLEASEVRTIHGQNERVRLDSFEKAIQFYAQLIEGASTSL